MGDKKINTLKSNIWAENVREGYARIAILESGMAFECMLLVSLAKQTKNLADENYVAFPKLFPNALTEKITGYDEDGKAIVERAIAFYEGTVKHIYFIAETKGTMESLELRTIEKAKISCARKLFNKISTENVVYHDVDSYQNLLNIINEVPIKGS